ncbi:MAG: C39 family peptidase [Clostridia bacterium]|nr:C39 family peptidase [Clostridia bacterium]
MIPKYTLTANELTPAIVSLGKYSTPVWIQQNWQEGEYAVYIRNNGCGHCCTAMALNLCGIETTPYEEYLLCREKFGVPKQHGIETEENFHSVSGIVKIMAHYGIKAECFGVPQGESKKASEHIEAALKNGSLVIFWSHPGYKLPDNPFSPGEHYVLAVGIDEGGRILIANSSERSSAKDGIQFTNIETIGKALVEGCEPQDFTWGRHDLLHSGGYVVVERKI